MKKITRTINLILEIDWEDYEDVDEQLILEDAIRETTQGVRISLANKNIVQKNVMISTWQTCPKCNGQGIMNKPSYVSGDQQGWMSSQMSHTCDVCDGKKIISVVGGKLPNSH